MPPAVQDSIISNVFFDVDFSSDGNSTNNNDSNNSWTHFQNEGNAFRSNQNDFKKAASFSPDTTSKTWASSTFDDSSCLSSPLHHPSTSMISTSTTGSTRKSSNNNNKKKPITRDDEQKVQQLVHAIRKEYQDVNTEAAQRKMTSHLKKKTRSHPKPEFYAESSFLDADFLNNIMEDQATSVAANRSSNNNNNIRYYSSSSSPQTKKLISPSSEPPTNDNEDPPVYDPFTTIGVAADLEDEEDDEDTQKPISFLNTSAVEQHDAFSDDDTLTLSLYSDDDDELEEESYERAERVHVLKESVLAILSCTLCSDPMALLTGNYEGCGRDSNNNDNNDDDDDEIPNVSDEEIQFTVEQSIDRGHDEIRL